MGWSEGPGVRTGVGERRGEGGPGGVERRCPRPHRDGVEVEHCPSGPRAVRGRAGGRTRDTEKKHPAVSAGWLQAELPPGATT